METELMKAAPTEGLLQDELVITQEVIQGLLEMLGEAWAEADQLRVAGDGPPASR